MDRERTSPLEWPLAEIAIEVTLRCNLKCEMCSVWQGKRDGLDSGVIRSLLDQARELGAATFVPCGGEPFMREGFVDLLAHAESRGFRRSEVVTNGLLVPRHLARLRELASVALHVSIDGPSEVHDRLRGAGVYDRALAAVCAAREAGVTVGISGVLMKPTIDGAAHVIDLAAGLGLEEVSFQPFQPEIHGMDRDASAFAFEPGERSRIEDAIAGLRELAASRGVRIYTDPVLDHVPAYLFEGLRPIPRGGCHMPSRFVLVNIDGELYPCFFMREESMGNVNRGERLADAWHSEIHSALQLLGLTSRCPGCLAACSDIATFGGEA
jgi:MoaA/NifB/PqqE/SkfB family radical SAM enzyme